MDGNTYPGVMAKDLKDVWDVLDGVADDEDEDDEKRNSGKSLLSLS